MTGKRTRYPTEKRVEDTVKLARKLGLRVTGIEVSPDGKVRTIDTEDTPRSAAEAWLDTLEAGERQQ